MKFAIPEISWHNRDPVLSVDFQPKCDSSDPLRLATGGTDSHVLIWYISICESGSVNLEVAADLTRHQKAVNIVRWSPNGKYLASGDDESIIFIWKQKTDKDPPNVTTTASNLEQGEEQYRETWVIHKTLRGHMEDILDISWSADSLHLASGSVDNKLLLWDVTKGRYSSILTDHKGFVQGVAWDPKGQIIASASTDRVFRTFDITTKKVTSRSSKATLPFPADHPFHSLKVRLYHDDTLQTFYRRLQFSPDGLLIAVPAGKIEPEQGKLDLKPINAVYIYTRYSLKVPACILPCGDSALVTRWSPKRYAVRASGPAPGFALPHRMVLAVGTKRSVMLYDTQQRTPIALVSNIHYTRLTDLTWSPDGLTLVASSTDGFCSMITFTDGELGEVLPDEVSPSQDCVEPMEIQTDESHIETVKEKTKTKRKINFTNRKSSADNIKNEKTQVKLDVLMETALDSWSDKSNSELTKTTVTEPDIIQIEDSEELKLVYEDTTDNTKSLINSKDECQTTTADAENVGHSNKTISAPSELETEFSKTGNLSPKTTADSSSKTESSSKDTNASPKTANGSPEVKSCLKENNTKNVEMSPVSSKTDFLKQAKVIDLKEPIAVKSVASPKTPRRVSFVTLSSPKSSKKK